MSVILTPGYSTITSKTISIKIVKPRVLNKFTLDRTEIILIYFNEYFNKLKTLRWQLVYVTFHDSTVSPLF